MSEEALKFDRLATDFNGQINTFLTTNDILAYTATSTLFRSTRWSTLINRVLKLVMDGEEKKVEQLLLIHPELSMMAGTATDFSGRTVNTTPWRYALWAWDTPMCNMMLDCLTDSPQKMVITQELILQFRTQEERGFRYTSNGETFHSTHFDLSVIINAHQYYSEHYKGWRADERARYVKPRRYWSEIIGNAQRSFPAYIAQNYTFSFRPTSDPKPMFQSPLHVANDREKTFHRNLMVRGYDIGGAVHHYVEVHWFEKPSSDPTRWSLGVNGGIHLGALSLAFSCDKSSAYLESRDGYFYPVFGSTRGVNMANCSDSHSGIEAKNIEWSMLTDLQTTNQQNLVLLHERLLRSLQQEPVCSCVIS